MYDTEYLASFPFFAQALRTTSAESLHDSLTGLIARRYMLPFIRDLIARGLPFTLAILDLDNFKKVNDSCGHRVGDQVLSAISGDLQDFVGTDGVVGRYGGDEFLLVYFKSIDYDEVHAFFMRMYQSGGVFRRHLRIEERSLFVTATVGSSAYPTDGDSFDEIFMRVDKALYRGKSKGRNCFIMYVPSKHENLQISSLAKQSLYEMFRGMAEGFDSAEDVLTRLWCAFLPMRESLRLDRLLYLYPDGRLIDVENGAELARLDDAAGFTPDWVCAMPTTEGLSVVPDALQETIYELGLESALLARVQSGGVSRGCLVICPEVHTKRIWQDDEYATAFILSRMLSQYFRNH